MLMRKIGNSVHYTIPALSWSIANALFSPMIYIFKMQSQPETGIYSTRVIYLIIIAAVASFLCQIF